MSNVPETNPPAADDESAPRASTPREIAADQRVYARAANARDWEAQPNVAARQALVEAITAFGPISDDREACARVLSALEEMFRPFATEPRKEIDEIFEEMLTGKLGEILVPLATSYFEAQPRVQVQAQTTRTRTGQCNCGPTTTTQAAQAPFACSFCSRPLTGGDGFSSRADGTGARVCNECVTSMAIHIAAAHQPTEAPGAPVITPAPNEPQLP